MMGQRAAAFKSLDTSWQRGSGRSRSATFALAVVSCCFASLTFASPREPDTDRLSHTKHLVAVPFQKVRIHDRFWYPRIDTHRRATVEANLHQCDITGRIRNFAVAAGKIQGKHQGFLFNDSDVYKVLEGIAYTLSTIRDPQLEARADRIIDLIAAAQQPDGYINTYYTLVKPKERWRNLAHGHELYCAGHLIEAGVAYYQATGKRKLLDVARRMADHIDRTFGPGKRVETSGHEEIELALIKLYLATGEERYLRLARFFLDVRGRADQRKLFGEYAQDHQPIRDQRQVAGHAVRAMYLYCAMADVAAITGDDQLMQPLETIWRDIVERRMYITGGIGSSASNEGFTQPFDLPNDTAYAETCAAIGMALWNHRMFLLTGDGKYADILEREVYNGLLSGVSLDGKRFFYTNPLASRGNHERSPWFACACCPTNIVRYVPAMGERVFATQGKRIYAVLYIGCKASVNLPTGTVELTEETDYPWDGDVTIDVGVNKPTDFELLLRVPRWCSAPAKLIINGHDGGKIDQKAPAEVRLLIDLPGYSQQRVQRDVVTPIIKASKMFPDLEIASITVGNEKATLRLRSRAARDGSMARQAATALLKEAPLPSQADVTVVDTSSLRRGYVSVRRRWRSEDAVRLSLPMPIQRVYANARVKANVGRVALQRGPVVFCLEGKDNGGYARNIILPRDSRLDATFNKDMLGGIVVISGPGRAVFWAEDGTLKTRAIRLRAIPYYAWANRGRSEMVVWIPESIKQAEVAGEVGVRVGKLLIRASHVNPSDSLEALHDRRIPRSSGDHSLPRMTWWDHRGTTEWVSYRFDKPRTLTGARVYWFDDTGRGACRVPASWRLLWHDGNRWRPVQLKAGSAYTTNLDRFNTVLFDPVTTREIKLEVNLKPGFSGGILEWELIDATNSAR